MVPGMYFGDAVGNDIIAIRDLLVSNGFETAIFSGSVDERTAKSHTVLQAEPLPSLSEEDILIFHLCIKSDLHHVLQYMKCRKIVIYHNITPPEFYEEYNLDIANICRLAIKEVHQLAEEFDYGLAVSGFNRSDLISYGYKCPIDVLPILIPFEDYDKKPNQTIIDKYDDGITNIIFVGRVVPNKKQEDVIAAFSCYKKNFDPSARLFLVGSSDGMESYATRLNEYIDLLGINDVFFTGKIPFDDILAYYKIADVFLCMSEHEGFCVPLVEAMHFNVPIIAYSSSAIPDTLAGSGILLHEKDPLITAGVINKLMTNSNLKEEIIQRQRKRVSDFTYEKTGELFLSYIAEFLRGKSK
jgi:glycosyltransferase involved in cell wall biosynthesis